MVQTADHRCRTGIFKRGQILKIILAPDKFKGSMTAEQVCQIEKEAILSVIPDAQIICVPLADGGEGTVRALTSANGGKLLKTKVRNPLGAETTAVSGIAGDTAFLEMAEASGMALLRPDELDPLKTSTYGTGEMIRQVLDDGIKNIIIGIGGSATVDGGTGMAEALGYKFYDKNGSLLTGLCGGLLQKIARIDGSGADPRLKNCKIRIASDVTNPLLGANGSVAVFAPQKGATAEMMPILENGLANLLEILKKQTFVSEDLPGDGAAGGLGLGLRAFCNAVPESGAKLAIAATHLEEKLCHADYLITGEGCSDSQTDNGKLCAVAAETCRKHNVRCILLSGKVTGKEFPAFDRVFATVPAETPFEEIKHKTAELLRQAALRLAESLRQADR